MSHVWGLFSHPDREMQVINRENETISHHYTHHVLLMAAIPVICAFIGTTQIGWNFGDGTILKLSWFTGLALAVLFYGVMLAGVAVMGRVIWWRFIRWSGCVRWSARWRCFTPATCFTLVFRAS